MAEGARLESVYTLTGIGGSNPSLSAIPHSKGLKAVKSAAAVSLVFPCRAGNLPEQRLLPRTHVKVSLYAREHGAFRYHQIGKDRSNHQRPPTSFVTVRLGKHRNDDNLSDATAKAH